MIAFLLIFFLQFSVLVHADETIVLLTEIEGADSLHTLDSSGKDVSLSPGDILEPGTVVSLPDGVSIGLTYENGAQVLVSSSAQFKIVKEETSIFKLLSGKIRVFFQTLHGKKQKEFKVRTSTVVVGVRGTDFVVEAGQDSASVHTLTGNVRVSDSDVNLWGEKAVKLGAGQFVSGKGRDFTPYRRVQKFKKQEFLKRLNDRHPRLKKLRQKSGRRGFKSWRQRMNKLRQHHHPSKKKSPRVKRERPEKGGKMRQRRGQGRRRNR